MACTFVRWAAILFSGSDGDSHSALLQCSCPFAGQPGMMQDLITRASSARILLVLQWGTWLKVVMTLLSSFTCIQTTSLGSGTYLQYIKGWGGSRNHRNPSDTRFGEGGCNPLPARAPATGAVIPPQSTTVAGSLQRKYAGYLVRMDSTVGTPEDEDGEVK